MSSLAMPFARAEASSFRVRKVEFGGIAALELRDERSGAYAVVARRGATLLAWRVPHSGEMVSLTDGYATAVEFDSQNGVRNGILAPFCNRIADGRYRFDDRDFDLLPGVPDDQRLIYHGFLREMELSVADVQESLAGASVLFTGVIRPDDFPGYPFALKLSVRVNFTGRGVALAVTGTNIGERAIPYSAGWHPYFRLGDAPIETLELTVPAARCVVTDGNLLPLPGDAAYAPVAQAALPDFREPRLIGHAVIDGCYADAETDADGLIRSRLRDPATGRRLTVWQRGGLTHIFTGDTLARGARRSIAIEPVEVMTDAFNRDECARKIRLPAGTTSSFSCGVEFDVDAASASLNPASSATE